MKKWLFVLGLSCGLIYTSYSQQLFVEAYTGYNFTAYDVKDVDQGQHLPIGFRLAGGLEHVQLGGEYRQHLTHPEFTYANSSGEDYLRQEFDETYYGGFLRANLSSLPAYRFGLILKAGAGVYDLQRTDFSLPVDEPKGGEEFDKKLGFSGGIGVSAPIYTLLHWEIGYQFNYVKPMGITSGEDFTAAYHSIQVGLSLNMVFGNTAKRCRRVISSRR